MGYELMKQVTIYMIRHGETIFNTMNKLQGWADSPLTPKGIDLAKTTGENLANTHFDYAFSSDMKRAIDTAKLIMASNPSLKNHSLTQLTNFREAFFGGFEGLDNDRVWNQVATPYGGHTQTDLLEKVTPTVVRDRMHQADPTGFAETGEQFWTRVNAGFEKLLTVMQDQSSAILVAHGTLIRSIAITYGQNKFDAVHHFPDNGSVTKLQLQPNQVTVLSYNEQH